MDCVLALKSLQNSIILTPCCPKAGPIGGEGFALPAATCNFIYAVIFLAILYSSLKSIKKLHNKEVLLRLHALNKRNVPGTKKSNQLKRNTSF
jgi:hypothetical protein